MQQDLFTIPCFGFAYCFTCTFWIVNLFKKVSGHFWDYGKNLLSLSLNNGEKYVGTYFSYMEFLYIKSVSNFKLKQELIRAASDALVIWLNHLNDCDKRGRETLCFGNLKALHVLHLLKQLLFLGFKYALYCEQFIATCIELFDRWSSFLFHGQQIQI